jgi:isovaleryl-CoA dehydrogenase
MGLIKESGREIPEEVAARTDQQNEFPAEMWKKLGEAG